MQHFRSWIGFGKLFPISSSKAIVEKHYRRNVKFSRAEDEMQISLKKVSQNQQSNKSIGRPKKAVKAPQTKSITIRLTRLTERDIAKALGKNIRTVPIEDASNNGTHKYNLRKKCKEEK